MNAWTAWGMTALVIGAVAYPAFGPPQQDNFPLSSYPMFSRARERVESLPRAVLEQSDGTIEILPPEAFGTDNVMQTVSMLWSAIRGGPQPAQALCVKLATHPLVRPDRPGTDGIIRIVLARFDVVQFFSGAEAPLDQDVVAQCVVQSDSFDRATTSRP